MGCGVGSKGREQGTSFSQCLDILTLAMDSAQDPVGSYGPPQKNHSCWRCVGGGVGELRTLIWPSMSDMPNSGEA